MNDSDDFSIDEDLLKDTDSESGVYDKYGRAKKGKLDELAFGREKNYMSLKIKNCDKNPLTIAGNPVYQSVFHKR